MQTLPVADAIYERALRHLPGGNSRTTVFVPPRPPYAVRGAGPFLYDADGRRLLDLNNNYTSLVHGHGRSEVVDVAVAAVRDGSCYSLPTEHEAVLAELLAARIPAAPKWRFANSGTEAVMMAIRLARAVTGRDGVLRFDGCYHGSYDAAMPPEGRGVPAGVAADVTSVPIGDADSLTEALEQKGDTLACVLFDAMPNRAGLIPAERAFVERLREETARRGIVLIQDEVITFRVAPGGIQSIYGIEPDVTTLGKMIGGGFPIGAIGGSAELMDAFDPRREPALAHAGTFSANPVSLRAGATAVELLTAGEIERINALGDRLRHALSEQGWRVTGHGSLARVHAADPNLLWWRLYEQGITTCANGLICLSTAVDDSHVETAIAAFGAVREGRA